MKYINEFLRKKKPETFMDYAPGEIPNKSPSPKPLTLGEVAPKATERVAPRVTTKEESTYTTSNKDLQNIHKNRTNAERHTGRSLRDESNRRTTYVGVGVPDDPHSRENDSTNPYGSPVKIVGDNVTKKDYDDFWTAFRNEGTGSKLNWAANQMQTQPKAQEKTQRQSIPQNRHSQNMMQWAMQERENLVKPQSLGRKRYVTDEDEAFRQGFFGEDYKDNEELQQRVNSAMRDIGNRRAGDTLRTYLAPENNIATRYTENASDRLLRKIYDIPEPGRYGWLSSEEGQKALDGVSLALSAGSLVPGVDTFTDLASIPVDLLRGDYMSAAFDAVGLIPFVGEVGDTAKLARIGANVIDATSDARRAVKAGAELIENADDAIDFAKYTDDIIETAKNADDIAEDIYSARKVDGTIQGHLDSVEDPIAEMKTLSKSIAKTSPIKIPENAVIKPKKTKAGYYHMEYDFSSDDGYQYITRWHTRNPTAPLEQRDVWVIERRIKGIGYGPNNRKEVREVWVGGSEWITKDEWKEAARANSGGYATEQQKEWLKNGHWKA